MQKQNFAESVATQFSGLKVTVEDVKRVVLKGKFDYEKPSKWDEKEVFRFARELRRESKPMIIAANKMDKENSKENLERMKKEFDYKIVGCFAEGELALREADKSDLIEYVPGTEGFEIKGEVSDKQKGALDAIGKSMKEHGGTGVQEVLNSVVFDLLEMIAIFPAGDKLEDTKGNVLPDCFLMKKGSTALDFAFRLHSDIGRDFIKAIDVRTKRAVGKDYELKHRDGLEIMTK